MWALGTHSGFTKRRGRSDRFPAELETSDRVVRGEDNDTDADSEKTTVGAADRKFGRESRADTATLVAFASGTGGGEGGKATGAATATLVAAGAVGGIDNEAGVAGIETSAPVGTTKGRDVATSGADLDTGILAAIGGTDDTVCAAGTDSEMLAPVETTGGKDVGTSGADIETLAAVGAVGGLDDKVGVVAGAEMLAPVGTTKDEDVGTSESGSIEALAAVGAAWGNDGNA